MKEKKQRLFSTNRDGDKETIQWLSHRNRVFIIHNIYVFERSFDSSVQCESAAELQGFREDVTHYAGME